MKASIREKLESMLRNVEKREKEWTEPRFTELGSEITEPEWGWGEEIYEFSSSEFKKMIKDLLKG